MYSSMYYIKQKYMSVKLYLIPLKVSLCLSPGFNKDMNPPLQGRSNQAHSCNNFYFLIIEPTGCISVVCTSVSVPLMCYWGSQGRAICRALNNAGLCLMWGTPLLHQHSSSPSSPSSILPIPLLSGTSSFSHKHNCLGL